MLIVGLLGLLAGLFFKFVPIIGKYSVPILIISFLLLITGSYLKGAKHNEDEWHKKIKELEAKVAIAEEKSKQVNTVIEYKYLTKIQKVKDVQYQIKEVIKEKEKIINANCDVPKEAIDIINAAARNEKAQ
jgi:hypothetical protein